MTTHPTADIGIVRTLLKNRNTAKDMGLEGTILHVDLELAKHVPSLLSHIAGLEEREGKLREALHHIGYEPLTDDKEASAEKCLMEATRIARSALMSKQGLRNNAYAT